MSDDDQKLLARATRRIGSGDLAGARKLLARIEPESLDQPRLLLQLAHAWLAAGMAHRAYAGLHLLAGVYHQRRMFLEEVAVLRHLLGFGADTVDLHISLARAYQRIGVVAEVQRHYLAALDEEPAGPRRERLCAEVEAFEPKSEALRWALSRGRDDGVSPEPEPEPAVRVETAPLSEEPPPPRRLAEENASLRPGETLRAYRLLTRLLAADPDDIEARECLADVYRWAGSRDGVIEQLNELIRIGAARDDSRTELWRQELSELKAHPEVKALTMITRAAAANPTTTHDDIEDALRAVAEAHAASE